MTYITGVKNTINPLYLQESSKSEEAAMCQILLNITQKSSSFERFAFSA